MDGKGHLAAAPLRLDIECRTEAPEGALREHASLSKMPILDPFERLLLPFQGVASRLTAATPQDRAVGLRRLFEHVGRQADCLAAASGVRHHRPKLFRRQIEVPGPGASHHLLILYASAIGSVAADHGTVRPGSALQDIGYAIERETVIRQRLIVVRHFVEIGLAVVMQAAIDPERAPVI